MIPSETLNTMGFGNLVHTVAYLQNLKTGLGHNAKKRYSRYKLVLLS